ncbi:MAG TPA: RCC1 domain-containing protein [Polyangia bacterium]|jgi:hypothetical protein|nr:RCC1 domain-containing protein [Polyangia bacterium]
MRLYKLLVSALVLAACDGRPVDVASEDAGAGRGGAQAGNGGAAGDTAGGAAPAGTGGSSAATSGASGAGGSTSQLAGAGGPSPAPGGQLPVVSPITAVGIGAAHACFVRANGTIECRGANDRGQATPPRGTFLNVVAGAYHTCAQPLVDNAPEPWVCWGDDSFGQTDAPAVPFDELTAGARHTCGRLADQITCWGDDSLGQTSVPPLQNLAAVTIAAGSNHTCAILAPESYTASDRWIVCWGDDTHGQSTPPEPGTTSQYFRLASGGDHSCVIGFSRLLTCWGDNAEGQSTAPTGDWTSVSVASGHGCALTLDGTLGIDCWGTDWGSAAAAPPAGKFGQVFTGDYVNCAIPQDQSEPTLCWGSTYEPWY